MYGIVDPLLILKYVVLHRVCVCERCVVVNGVLNEAPQLGPCEEIV